MKIVIEVPVETDGELNEPEKAKLSQHLLEQAADLEPLLREFWNPEPRMLGTVCRFRFGRPVIKVVD